MGWEEYEPISRRWHVPIVVTGFEPLDLMEGVQMAIAQLEQGRAEVENQYRRAVRREGNRPAQQRIAEVFEVAPRKWRGIGEIPLSGLRLRERYRALDAEERFPVGVGTVEESSECIAGLVLQGLKSRLSARLLEPAARRNLCWVRLWYRPKAHALPIISTEGVDMKEVNLSCPVPRPADEFIVLAHGGGKLTNQLIERVFLPSFGCAPLEARHDGAVLNVSGVRLAFTTDSYVVRPLMFPGGTIGDLAVNGTVNDLAMCGARPLYLSAGFILEEGLPMETLRTIVASMRTAAELAGVQLVTGDTKVVDKGKGDGVFINTAGIGAVETPLEIGPAAVRAGDAIIVSAILALMAWLSSRCAKVSSSKLRLKATRRRSESQWRRFSEPELKCTACEI